MRDLQVNDIKEVSCPYGCGYTGPIRSFVHREADERANYTGCWCPDCLRTVTLTDQGTIEEA